MIRTFSLAAAFAICLLPVQAKDDATRPTDYTQLFTSFLLALRYFQQHDLEFETLPEDLQNHLQQQNIDPIEFVDALKDLAETQDDHYSQPRTEFPNPDTLKPFQECIVRGGTYRTCNNDPEVPDLTSREPLIRFTPPNPSSLDLPDTEFRFLLGRLLSTP